MTQQDEQTIKDYKDLHIWQKGMKLAQHVYLLTQKFPTEEKFGLVPQMRRAAVSIPSNIAEGQARNPKGEYVQSLSPAEGSAAELDTQLRLSIGLGYCMASHIENLLTLLVNIQKMLKRLRSKLTTGQKLRIPNP